MARMALAKKTDKSVLVVEDDQVIARLLRAWLAQRGFDVEVRSNGREALDNINADAPPRLVFLDIVMPYADGFEVLSRMRATRNWEIVPIIMLTSKTSESNIIRAFDAGANDYVTKPFKPAELMARMTRLLR